MKHNLQVLTRACAGFLLVLSATAQDTAGAPRAENVNSAQEKDQIGEMANTAAHSENVQNQLEVKLSSNN
ncbi:MAG TPA: hypothetical protein VMR33_14485 [Candidatus Baltobacteraceae bacterium]|nr:hypothetical protein [Candidatus Baltobacteraceae bacterium]